ncbi:SGNH/GDSL hydrolase family protein [Tundrisphaera sp. TA3]|uniref:SGNH/GDSL hydrolase family protein n=1 Tax=Tundrisphaera sp. TA3 TaxID=3435775 RepID=UPI003EC00BB8
MRLAHLAVLSALAWPTLAAAEDGPKPFAIKPGDRVVFYGDSITDQRLYTTFAETFVVTRFPKSDVSFIHSGWGGDRVGGGLGGPIDLRLNRDVVAYKPTVVTVMLGMNDASYQQFRDEIFNTYAKGYEHIVEKLKADLPGVRLTLIRPSPFDDVTREPKFEGGYNQVLVRYGDFVAKLAEKEGAGVADLNAPVVEATKKAFASDPKGAEKLNPDRVHPGLGGQLLMAAALLKAWNAPAVVSTVTIEAKPGAPADVQANNTVVTDLAAEGDGLRWTQKDEALPFPIDLKDPATALAVQSSDIVEALDRQIVQVKGWDGAKEYTLSIDGAPVGTFTGAALAQGVNLATLPTPMARQAADVHNLTLRHSALHNLRWRQVEVPNQDIKDPRLGEALRGLDRLESAIVDDQRAAAQPRPHTFTLKPKG